MFIFFNRRQNIIRVANEGFVCKPYFQGPTSMFLDVVITDLNQHLAISEPQSLRYINDKMEGCFCFLPGFDEKQLEDDGNLFYRKNHKFVVGSLPKNELVFVRNTKNNNRTNSLDRFVYGQFTNQINPVTNQPAILKFRGHVYEFVQMPLHLAMKRLELHKKQYGIIPEELSEIYLTKKQIEEKLKIL